MAGQPDLGGQARTQIGEAGVTLRVPRGPYCPLPPGLGTCSSLGPGIPHHPVIISDSYLLLKTWSLPGSLPAPPYAGLVVLSLCIYHILSVY